MGRTTFVDCHSEQKWKDHIKNLRLMLFFSSQLLLKRTGALNFFPGCHQFRPGKEKTPKLTFLVSFFRLQQRRIWKSQTRIRRSWIIRIKAYFTWSGKRWVWCINGHTKNTFHSSITESRKRFEPLKVDEPRKVLDT